MTGSQEFTGRLAEPRYVFKLRRPRAGVTPEIFQLFPIIHGKRKEKYMVGRHGSECDIFVFVEEQPNFLSRTHACIRQIRMKAVTDQKHYDFTIEDNNSMNGMHVNGKKLARGERHLLSHTDRIFFGDPNHSFFIEYEFLVVTQESPLYKLLSLEALRLGMDLLQPVGT